MYRMYYMVFNIYNVGFNVKKKVFICFIFNIQCLSKFLHHILLNTEGFKHKLWFFLKKYEDGS